MLTNIPSCHIIAGTAFRKIKPCRGAPTSPSQTYTGLKVILYHESRDLVGFLRGKPQLWGEPKLHRDSYTQDIPLRQDKTSRTSRRVDDPDKSRVSQSQDTSDEHSIQWPDRHLPSCPGLAPHMTQVWTNAHEEHLPRG